MKISAGVVSMFYEDGFLRDIRVGNEMVLSRIYFAVRDSVWDTLPSVIVDERVDLRTDGFMISYQRHFDHGGARMWWEVRIEGTADGSILFEIHGRALSDFEKNRAGFCVLHPIASCAGKPVSIIHTDGTAQLGAFPLYISPHQPFKDISGMRWPVGTGYEGRLTFGGDVFEMEDQRNWTDNSYKTYCTPLALPFPAKVCEGDEIRQQVRFSLDVRDVSIGVMQSAERGDGYLRGLEMLSAVGFSHYRVELGPGEHWRGEHWRGELKRSLEESRVLGAPLELVIGAGFGSLELLADAVGDFSQVRSFILPFSSLSEVAALKATLPGVLIGVGTDGPFADLNRAELDFSEADFVSYAIHPQVHASDDQTLMENAAAQGYTVATAIQRYGKPVHVSPVMLHERRVADVRYHTELAADWVRCSLSSLIGAGAASITYFEAVGTKGLVTAAPEWQLSPVVGIFDRLRY